MTKKILIVFSLLLLILIPAHVSATSDIKLLGSSTRIDFPNLLTFNIKAESSATITRIRLRYEVDKMTYAPTFAEAWPDFPSGKSVSVNWAWDMRKGSLPPGAKITFWWVIEDNTGNKLTTPKEIIYFDDTRYKWQKISDKNISIFWYQGSNSFAEAFLKAAVDATERLGQDTGVSLDKPVSLYIYANYRDLRGSIVATEEWTGGVAYSGFNIISIGIAPNNLEWGKGAVAHELGHLVTHQVTVSPYAANLPPWLDEGLAMHAEGPQSESDKGALRKAIANGAIATLKSLSSPFSANPEEAFYAYAQSQSVIEYLVNSFGKSKINDLLVLLNGGYTMDEALTKVYGFNLSGLDKEWTNWLMSQPDKKTTSHSAPAPAFGKLLLHPSQLINSKAVS